MNQDARANDAELLRRSVASFGEIIATVGLWGDGAGSVVRWPDAIGARLDRLGRNPWFNAAVVPADESVPVDDPLLPYCLWTLGLEVPGRTEDVAISTPCMGMVLESFSAGDQVASGEADDLADLVTPSLAELGAMNDRAYETGPVLAPMAARIQDDRIATHGLRKDGRLACVLMTLTLGDDLGIHYVATDPARRRMGLATRLVSEVLTRGCAAGLRTATLQASPDGLPVYRRMGFRQVGVLHGFVRTLGGQVS